MKVKVVMVTWDESESYVDHLGQAESVRGGAGQSGGEERTSRWERRETWGMPMLFSKSY